MNTFPRFEYGTNSPQDYFDFNVWPFSEEIVPDAKTFLNNVPGADINSDTENVSKYIFTNDLIYLDIRNIVEADIASFWTWWNEVKNGQEWTYYPDKNTLGTNYTVVEAMNKFSPKQKNSIYSFVLKFQVVS
jgi:hypothetical protein